MTPPRHTTDHRSPTQLPRTYKCSDFKGRLRPFPLTPPRNLTRPPPGPPGLDSSYLKVDLVHHLVVGLELVELHFEVRRRQDIGQDHGVEVHSLLIAPQRQHISLLARDRRLSGAAAATAALLLLLSCGRGRLVLRLRVACQRGAVVSHVAAEGRREGEGRGRGPSSISLFGTTVRDPTPWNAVRRGGRLAVPQLDETGQRGRRQKDPGSKADAETPAARTPSRRRAGGHGARSLPPTAPGNKMAGPADVTSHVPEFQAEPAANQRRPAGLEIPLPSSARSVHAADAAVVSSADS